jgi:hypothetical protein
MTFPSVHGSLSSWLSSLDSSTNNVYKLLIYTIHAPCYAWLSFLNLIILMILGER